jgi:hypothetical protein
MLENLQPTKKPPSCKVRTLAESLEAKDRAILESALTDSKWNPNSLSVALKQRGVELSNKLIRKHQLQECSCSKIGS